MLVDPDRGAVDHDQFTVESGADRGQKPIPHARFAPTHEAVVAGSVGTIPLWDVGPRTARAKAPQYPVDHPPIINSGNAPHLVRQQRLDYIPLQIGKLKSA